MVQSWKYGVQNLLQKLQTLRFLPWPSELTRTIYTTHFLYNDKKKEKQKRKKEKKKKKKKEETMLVYWLRSAKISGSKRMRM